MYRHLLPSCSTTIIISPLPTTGCCDGLSATTNTGTIRPRKPSHAGAAYAREKTNGFSLIRSMPMPCSIRPAVRAGRTERLCGTHSEEGTQQPARIFGSPPAVALPGIFCIGSRPGNPAHLTAEGVSGRKQFQVLTYIWRNISPAPLPEHHRPKAL